jgi:hypothetical protein
MGDGIKGKYGKQYDKISDTQKQITSFRDFINLTDFERAALRSDPKGKDVTKEINAGSQLKQSMDAVVKGSKDKTSDIRKDNEKRKETLKRK